jgi:hypothetical protein
MFAAPGDLFEINMKYSLYAPLSLLFVSILTISTSASAQSSSHAVVSARAVASVSIVDGIQLGIKKSTSEGYDLLVEANGLKAAWQTRREERPASASSGETLVTEKLSLAPEARTEIVAVFE